MESRRPLAREPSLEIPYQESAEPSAATPLTEIYVQMRRIGVVEIVEQRNVPGDGVEFAVGARIAYRANISENAFLRVRSEQKEFGCVGNIVPEVAPAKRLSRVLGIEGWCGGGLPEDRFRLAIMSAGRCRGGAVDTGSDRMMKRCYRDSVRHAKARLLLGCIFVLFNDFESRVLRTAGVQVFEIGRIFNRSVLSIAVRLAIRCKPGPLGAFPAFLFFFLFTLSFSSAFLTAIIISRHRFSKPRGPRLVCGPRRIRRDCPLRREAVLR